MQQPSQVKIRQDGGKAISLLNDTMKLIGPSTEYMLSNNLEFSRIFCCPLYSEENPCKVLFFEFVCVVIFKICFAHHYGLWENRCLIVRVLWMNECRDDIHKITFHNKLKCLQRDWYFANWCFVEEREKERRRVCGLVAGWPGVGVGGVVWVQK